MHVCKDAVEHGGCASGTWIGRVSDHAAHGAVELKSYRSIGQWQPSVDLGVDPIGFRLRYLLNDACAIDVLKAVAEKSPWPKVLLSCFDDECNHGDRDRHRRDAPLRRLCCRSSRSRS